MHVSSIFYSPKKALLAIFGITALLLAPDFSNAAKTEYPLTIRNCGHDITFDQTPMRAATVGRNSTEILYLLGLADRVVGISLWLGPVLDTYKIENEKVAVIVQNIPSFERISAKKPDLVASQFEWQIGPAGMVASYEQFSELKVPVYVAPADCAKDSEDGGDGARKGIFDITMVYREVADLARIFNIQDRGEVLIASLKAREAVAKDKITGIDKNVSAVFWFLSADLQLDSYVAGKFGPAAWIAQTLGVKNVTDSAKEWSTVGWKAIVKVNPPVIVLGEMSRRRLLTDDWKIKMECLKSDPVTALVPIVKENHLPVIDVQTMNAGIRTIDGLEKPADALVEYGLAHPQTTH